MPNLTTVDWLVLLLYCTTVFGIGFSLKPFTTTAKDYFQAGRALPAWLCALALVAASLGAPEILAMAAAGARYGLAAACFFSLGAVPALLFLGLYLMPVYYGSGARTIPEYLRLRFGRPAGLLHAWLFVAMALFTAGLSLYLMATVFQTLHVFDRFFISFSWYQQSSFSVLVALSVLLVAAYVLQGGLAGSLYGQTVQFALLIAAMLPLVYLGLRGVGGWSGLRAALPAASGASGSLIAFALGLVFAAGYWCVDLRVLQAPLAAKDAAAARQAPLLAAGLRLFVPLLLIVPGIVAIGLPTPQTTTTVTTTPDGAIVHQIDVVPPAAAAGHGLVPAILDPVTAQPFLAVNGKPQLDYNMALPNVVVHFLPTGLLGLALAALLACCMSGLAANITAISAVFSIDLFPAPSPSPNPSAGGSDNSDRRSVLMGRLAAAAALLLAAAIAYALHGFANPVPALLLVFALVNMPLLAVVLLGIFWPRATGPGAVAGLIAGFLAPLLLVFTQIHTLPGGRPGLTGNWRAVIHPYPHPLAYGFYAVLVAFAASLLVAAAVSLFTATRQDSELTGLVHELAPCIARAEQSSINLDVRLPIGLMFTMIGAFLAAFGFSTRSASIYSASLGLNVNLGCGLVLLVFGVLLFFVGRRCQLAIENSRQQPAAPRK